MGKQQKVGSYVPAVSKALSAGTNAHRPVVVPPQQKLCAPPCSSTPHASFFFDECYFSTTDFSDCVSSSDPLIELGLLLHASVDESQLLH